MSEDNELLRRYVLKHSDDAFAELVRRYVDLVYSAALRLVNGDTHRAEDITQQVFAECARQAGRLVNHPALVGWLYTTTRRSALRTVRTEQRRRARELEATSMNELLRESSLEPDWERLRPVLEDAMHELGEKDRNAVLLRFFQNQSLKEVGAALGLGENAARMRVDRALAKLHGLLLRRGMAGSASVAALLSANAVQAAPASLAATIAATSVATVTSGASALTLLKIMTATQIKIGISALVVAGATTALVVQHQAQQKLLGANEVLVHRLAQLEADNNGLSNRLSGLAASKAATDPSPGGQNDELLRLRGEVGVLRQQKNAFEKALAQVPQPRHEYSTLGASQAPLPGDYPTTADGATKNLFELMSKGDWNGFTNFDIEGGRDQFIQELNNASNYLRGMEIVSIGEPTNSFGPNMWFVPYTLRFADGGQKSFRLHVAQDPVTQRWILKGGF